MDIIMGTISYTDAYAGDPELEEPFDGGGYNG
jgi:hypothetical protein